MSDFVLEIGAENIPASYVPPAFAQLGADATALLARERIVHEGVYMTGTPRRLVLIVREAPLNLAHLRNMAAVTEMGGIIFPPVPALYARPRTIDDMLEHTVGRVLDLFGIASKKLKRWQGMDG